MRTKTFTSPLCVMNIRLTEDKLIELFIEIDDLLIAYTKYQAQEHPTMLSEKRPTRKPSLSASEVATIIVCYHLSGYRTFEYYYKEVILKQYKSYFPVGLSYSRFVQLIPRSLPCLVLWSIHSCAKSLYTGYYFIDSKKLQVCHLKREKSHKVFKDYAKKGKTSTGWFYGLKIHLVINHLGQIVAFSFTPGNVADNNQKLLQQLVTNLKGYLIGDKGYYTKLFETFYENGLHLILRPKKNMKAKPVESQLVSLNKKRAVIESVNDILMTVCEIEHTRHRSPINGICQMIAAIIAYQGLENKPHVYIPQAINYLGAA